MTSTALLPETIRFALDSVEYSIDLSGRNAEKLRGDMEKWVRAAQKIGVGDLERRRTVAGRPQGRESLGCVEQDRGCPARCPRKVIEQYHAAGH